jgi:riboflavin kinase/FMN adenylyltransferase
VEALASLRGLGASSAMGQIGALLSEPEPTGAVARLWPADLADCARDAGLLVEQGPWGQQSADLGARICELVAAGRMREATAALGYAYTVTGDVVGGDRRGRLLGFPTANLRLEPSKLTPKHGIYAGWVRLPGSSARWPAAISVGVRPTVGEGLHQQIEAYLLDVSMDLYGLQLRLEFVDYLREELRFDSFEALIQQMGYDREQARTILRAEAEER